LKEKDEKKFGSESEMSLSLQPGLNEALYRLLQRKQWKRNCEKRRKKLGSNNRKTLTLQPRSKDGKRRKRREERESKNNKADSK
jgi:hypothetical protein